MQMSTEEISITSPYFALTEYKFGGTQYTNPKFWIVETFSAINEHIHFSGWTYVFLFLTLQTNNLAAIKHS